MNNPNPLGHVGETNLEQVVSPSPEEMQHQQEREAFNLHMATSNEKIPENFQDAGAYFDSLKEAQKQFTQSKQETSELRQESEILKARVEELRNQSVVAPLTDQLRIPSPSEIPAPVPAPVGLDEATYQGWGLEFASTGDFSIETKNDIKTRTGFSDRMVNDYVDAQKAKLREGYSKAAVVVGGPDRLDKIFKWASNNLESEKMQGVNIGLASSTYEITLRGLAAMYDGRVTEERSKEPAPNPNLTQVAASQTGVIPYQNQREFKAERNDPKFHYEPAFRDLVQKRMSMTDWNTLPV